jgi:hypothetical protein
MTEFKSKASTLMGIPPEIRLMIADILQFEDSNSIFDLAAASRKLYSEVNNYRFCDIQLTLVNRKKLTADLTHWNKLLLQTDGFSSVQRLTIQGSLPPILKDDEGNELTAVLWSSTEDRGNINELTSREEFYEQDFGGKSLIHPNPEYNGWSPLPEFVSRLVGLKDLVWRSLTLFPPPILKVVQHKFDQKNLITCKLHILTYNLPCFFQKPSQRHGTNWYEYHLATSPCLSSIVLSMDQRRPEAMARQDKLMLYELATSLSPNLTKLNIMDVSSELPRRLNDLPRPTSNQSTKRNSLQGLSLNWDNHWEWTKQDDFNEIRVLQLWLIREENLRLAANREYPALNSLALQPFETVDDELVRRFVCSLSPLDSLHLCGAYSQETFEAILDVHGESLRKLCLVPMGKSDVFDYRRITPSLLHLIRTHCPNLQEFRLPTIRSAGNRDECDLYRALGKYSKVINLTLELQQCDQCPDMDLGEFKDYVERARRREWRTREWLTNIAVDERLVREIFSFITRTSSPLRRLRIGFDTSLRSVQPDFNYKGDRKITKFMSRQYVAFRCDGDRLVVREIGAKARKFKEADDPCSLGIRLGEHGCFGFFSVFPAREVVRRVEDIEEKERDQLFHRLKYELIGVESWGGDQAEQETAARKADVIIQKFKQLNPGVYEWCKVKADQKAREEAKEKAAAIAKEKAEKKAAARKARRFNKWAQENPEAYDKWVWDDFDRKQAKIYAEEEAVRKADEEAKAKEEAYEKYMASSGRNWGDDRLDGVNSSVYKSRSSGYNPRYPDDTLPEEFDPEDWWNKWYSHPLTDKKPEKFWYSSW